MLRKRRQQMLCRRHNPRITPKLVTLMQPWASATNTMYPVLPHLSVSAGVACSTKEGFTARAKQEGSFYKFQCSLPGYVSTVQA
ncbi:hypothetical protein TNCV_1809461 [Trichonephila clavipes]|nr:hypothetical protein TNCV_1809461 [Trichonephila clavipes]